MSEQSELPMIVGKTPVIVKSSAFKSLEQTADDFIDIDDGQDIEDSGVCRDVRAPYRTKNPQAWAKYSILETRFKAGELIVLDGATGTELTERGISSDKQWNGWPAQLFHPDIVRDVHRSYIRAGADLITTNTYGTNRHVIGDDGSITEERLDEANTLAVKLCREACGIDSEVLVAGSMSNHPPAITKFAKDVSVDECTTINLTKMAFWPEVEIEKLNYSEQAKSLVKGGADILFLEMVKDRLHGDLLVSAAVETGLPVVIGLTLSTLDSGAVVARDDHTFSVEEMIHKWKVHPSIVGFSAMHINAHETEAHVKAIRASWDGFIGAYPNQGKFVPPMWEISEPIPAWEYRELASKWRLAGANAIGGCCGIGPDIIAEIGELSREISRANARPKYDS